MSSLHAVTGAFGYSGKYITRELLARGERVRTLTRPHPDRPNPFGAQIEIAPLNFANFDELVQNLTGATTLYNTYWVRFPRGQATFDSAVENTKTLLRAAHRAGVRRVVQISVSNPSLDSPYAYFRGKAQLEHALAESGLSYAIIRPTVIYGPEDILINNIAWLLRWFPVFAIPGSGAYRIQPVSAEDNATLAVDAGERQENLVLDAAGPEIYPYEELVRLVARAVGSHARIVHLPAGVFWGLAWILGKTANDVLLTREEIGALVDDLLVSHQPPTGKSHFSGWLQRYASTLGTQYASELGRHFR
ncbi:MAG TPA: NAD(P)H-binding protein [Terriglobales bacterium]|jgi:NADH dehydrogenase|nr:NAD(P)H-binding protein [Terriglobales bacterium]